MTELLYSNLTYRLQGCFYDVYNNLGYGHKETVYQNALEKELKHAGIAYEREKSLQVNYKEENVGLYRPDFLVDDKVIVEVKALKYLPKTMIRQLINYLKITNYSLGFVVNFGADKIQIVRRVWTDRRGSNNVT